MFGKQVPQSPPKSSYVIRFPAKDWSGSAIGKDGEMLREYTRTIQELIDKLTEPWKFKAALDFAVKENYEEQENCMINGCRPSAEPGFIICPKTAEDCRMDTIVTPVWKYYREMGWVMEDEGHAICEKIQRLHFKFASHDAKESHPPPSKLHQSSKLHESSKLHQSPLHRHVQNQTIQNCRCPTGRQSRSST